MQMSVLASPAEWMGSPRHPPTQGMEQTDCRMRQHQPHPVVSPRVCIAAGTNPMAFPSFARCSLAASLRLTFMGNYPIGLLTGVAERFPRSCVPGAGGGLGWRVGVMGQLYVNVP